MFNIIQSFINSTRQNYNEWGANTTQRKEIKKRVSRGQCNCETDSDDYNSTDDEDYREEEYSNVNSTTSDDDEIIEIPKELLYLQEKDGLFVFKGSDGEIYICIKKIPPKKKINTVTITRSSNETNTNNEHILQKKNNRVLIEKRKRRSKR